MDPSGMSLDELLSLGKDAAKSRTATESDAAKAIAEAQDIKKNETERLQRKTKNDATIAGQKTDLAQSKTPFGITDPTLLGHIERGPLGDPEGFARAAHDDPEGAQTLLDNTKMALGIDAPGATNAAPIRKGTQHTANGDIPYFTNLAGNAGAEGGPMADVTGLMPYASGASAGSKLDEWASSNDPMKRAVARKLSDAESNLKYGDKGSQVIGRKVASMIPGAEKDIAALGPDAASDKWMQGVASGDYPLAVVGELTQYTKDKAASQSDAEFAQHTNEAREYARWNGTESTLAKLRDMRADPSNGWNPRHIAAVEADIKRSGVSAVSKQGVMDPEGYLPQTTADVAQWNDKRQAPDFVQNPFRPLTVANPKGTQAVPSMVEDAHAQASQGLLDQVQGAPSIGAPAKTAYSYTTGGGGGAAPPDSGIKEGPGYSFGRSFFDAGPTGPGSRILPEGSGGIGDELALLSSGINNRAEEGPLTRAARLKREAARRARGA